jgi:hypothetical protein
MCTAEMVSTGTLNLGDNTMLGTPKLAAGNEEN